MDNDKLFQIMRFNILYCTASIPEKPLDPAYLFAWKVGVFPLQQDHYGFHNPFNNEFTVSDASISELRAHLDAEYSEGSVRVSTFYDLEQCFPWSRENLIHACRYLCQSGLFGDSYWQKVVAPAAHPIEAACIIRPLGIEDLR